MAVITLAWPQALRAQAAAPTQQQDVSPTVGAEARNARRADVSETWALHGQATVVWQYHPGFRSPYRGPNSLDPNANGNETADLTLYGGVRPWRGAEAWVNLEVDQGFGLSKTLGVAGFPSGEAYKVGAYLPYVRLPRAFLRQTVGLGDGTESVAPASNQLGGTRAEDRLVFTLGKFAVVDIFDTNQYAHDPRMDFLNWSIIDIGSFDYAADAWGYTYGVTAEWYHGRWTLRTGTFTLSRVPNSEALDTRFVIQDQYVLELEERHEIRGQPGKVKLLGFVLHGRMGAYDDATSLAQATGVPADITAVRRHHTKAGIGLNLEQQLAPEFGVFARAGFTQGRYEAFEFTDITKTVSFGLSLAGGRWGRPNDTFGLAMAINDASSAAKRFFNAGGLGILAGDGQLRRAGAEHIVETYYSFAPFEFARLSLDYQFINHPAYNRDRGPVSVFGVRAHIEF